MDVKEELVKSANEIRDKYRALKRGKFLEAEERFQAFQPLIEPLKELKQIAEKPPINDMQIVRRRYSASTPSRVKSLLAPRIPHILSFGPIASEYLGNYLSKGSPTDTTYGLRQEGSNNFYIGEKKVEITNDDVEVGDKTYTGTKGLWELLTLKEPKQYTETDLKDYKEILEATNAHKKGYKADAAIASNRHSKYINIIKPLFKTSGEGVRRVTGNKIDYVYWDDPNELVNRLRLLWLSREAGNSGVDNEINSIIEELKECGIIQ